MKTELNAAIEAAKKLVAAAQARFDSQQRSYSAVADHAIKRADGSGAQDRRNDGIVEAASRDFR